TLVIDAAMRDAKSQPLAREYRREFSASAEIHARLDLATWKLDAPRAGTREPLRVVAPVALDHALALRCLHVHSVEGAAALADDERTWTFTPASAWTNAPHALAADAWLEDLAGNTFERVFDDDLTIAPAEHASQTIRDFTPTP